MLFVGTVPGFLWKRWHETHWLSDNKFGEKLIRLHYDFNLVLKNVSFPKAKRGCLRRLIIGCSNLRRSKKSLTSAV
jgi:hypothetical protein